MRSLCFSIELIVLFGINSGQYLCINLPFSEAQCVFLSFLPDDYIIQLIGSTVLIVIH